MEKRLIDANAFALELRTMKNCLLGAPGCGKDRAKVVEMVEKMLSAAPTIEPEVVKLRSWPEWRTLKEMPTEKDAGLEGFILAVDDRGDANMWEPEYVTENPEEFTYWMPTPQPPVRERSK